MFIQIIKWEYGSHAHFGNSASNNMPALSNVDRLQSVNSQNIGGGRTFQKLYSVEDDSREMKHLLELLDNRRGE